MLLQLQLLTFEINECEWKRVSLKGYKHKEFLNLSFVTLHHGYPVSFSTATLRLRFWFVSGWVQDLWRTHAWFCLYKRRRKGHIHLLGALVSDIQQFFSFLLCVCVCKSELMEWPQVSSHCTIQNFTFKFCQLENAMTVIWFATLLCRRPTHFSCQVRILRTTSTLQTFFSTWVYTSKQR